MRIAPTIVFQSTKVFVVCGLLFAAPTASADTALYWSEWDSEIIERGIPESMIPEDIDVPGTPIAIALDEARGKIYWADNERELLLRANFDGTGEETLVSGLFRARGIALDTAAAKVYWIEHLASAVRRADLDGSNPETLVTGLASTQGAMALDTTNGKIYWATHTGIYWSALDGSGSEVLPITLGDTVINIAVDPASSKLYWTEEDPARIRRANLDGTGSEVVLSEGGRTIALNTAAGKIIYSTQYSIYIANANGTDKRAFHLRSGNTFYLQHINGMTVDAAQEHLYWTEQGKIRRLPIYGRIVDSVAQTPPTEAEDIAFDFAEAKMYWTDYQADSIYRANLDGSDRTKIADAFSTCVAFDPVNRQLYWREGTGIIRANPDGSNPTMIFTVASPDAGVNDIELDAAGGKIYWAEVEAIGFSSFRWRIYRGNLDGSSPELLIGESERPATFELDLNQGKLYCVTANRDILSCNLDGSGLAQVPLVDAPDARRLAVDADAGFLYWYDSSMIWRAGLDGSNPEFVTGTSGALHALAIGTMPNPHVTEIGIGGPITSSATPGFIAAGSSLTLSAPEGTDYQWYRDGIPLSGETGNTLTITDLSPIDEGSYTVRYTDPEDGRVESPAFTLRVSGASSVPAAGLPSMLILAAALTLLGARQRTSRKSL